MRRLPLAVLLAAATLTAADARAADPLQNAHGGRYTTPSGATVAVYTSALLPVDDTVNQHWADFLDTLAHGPELADLTLVIEPFGQIQQQCGLGAYACYRDGMIISVGDRVPPDGPSAEGVIAHEYGHHLAAHRSNAPWDAVRWGTKRWATAMGVCAKVRAGLLHPGDEAAYYLLNPGEAFAESYRLLNETLLQLPVTPWGIVSAKLRPTQAALDALREDVEEPWAEPAPQLFAGTFKAGGTDTRTFAVATPYDGTLTASVSGSGGTFRVSIAGKRTARGTVCGARTTQVSVTRIRGAGRFTLTVDTP